MRLHADCIRIELFDLAVSISPDYTVVLLEVQHCHVVGDILHVGRTLGASIEDDHIDK